MNRKKILLSAQKKKRLIYRKDLEDANALANQPPESELFYTLEEIGVLIEDLMGIESPVDENGRLLDVRPKGHWFEFEVAKHLGYNYPPSSGLFPDIRHQALEIKHHTGKNVTVDFGKYHPGSDKIIDEIWNRKFQLRINQIRYIIALAPPPEHVITTMIILTGANIMDVFGVPPKETIKYQMGIPKKWREKNRGKIVVGK